jgi:hypothetical protein
LRNRGPPHPISLRDRRARFKEREREAPFVEERVKKKKRGQTPFLAGYPGVPEPLIHDDRPGRTVGDVAAEVGMYMLTARKI